MLHSQAGPVRRDTTHHMTHLVGVFEVRPGEVTGAPAGYRFSNDEVSSGHQHTDHKEAEDREAGVQIVCVVRAGVGERVDWAAEYGK